MKTTKFILCMGALLTLNLVPIRAIAGNAGMPRSGIAYIRSNGANWSRCSRLSGYQRRNEGSQPVVFQG